MNTEKQIKILVYVLLMALIGFAIGVYFKMHSGLRPYKWSNGESIFEVMPVKEKDTIMYAIKIYFPNDPKPYLIYLRYGPREVSDIKLDGQIKKKIADDKLVYITIDPEENLTGKTVVGALEITKFLANRMFYNIPVKSALTKKHGNKDVKTCADATDKESIIWLKLGNETKVYSSNNCIIVQGINEEEIIRASDRLCLHLLGIMR